MSKKSKASGKDTESDLKFAPMDFARGIFICPLRPCLASAHFALSHLTASESFPCLADEEWKVEGAGERNTYAKYMGGRWTWGIEIMHKMDEKDSAHFVTTYFCSLNEIT